MSKRRKHRTAEAEVERLNSVVTAQNITLRNLRVEVQSLKGFIQLCCNESRDNGCTPSTCIRFNCPINTNTNKDKVIPGVVM